MSIYWQEIKDKYPKAYEIFINYLSIKKNIDIFICLPNELNKYICYCDIEKFFDKQGIIILISICNAKLINEKLKYLFYYEIGKIEKNIIKIYEGWKRINDNYLFKNRQEAKEQAVYKAFEILENKL